MLHLEETSLGEENKYFPKKLVNHVNGNNLVNEK